jgi:hypothetical protein
MVTHYYERILSHASCGLLVISSTGTILSANPETSHMLSLSAADLLRQDYRDLPCLVCLKDLVEETFQSEETQDPQELEIPLGEGIAALSVRVRSGHGYLGGRDVCMLSLEVIPATREDSNVHSSTSGTIPGPSSSPPSDPELALRLSNTQEDLFALRMMVELLSSKASNPELVADVSQDLLEDLDRVIHRLKE